MQRRKMFLIVGVLLLLGTAACMVSALLINYAAGVNIRGSAELASEWKANLEPLTVSADDLRKDHPDLEVVLFSNGEWVIGTDKNSHGLFARGGGTIVVKDSRGQIRAFFGHVCGPHYLQTFFRDITDLDRFYARMNQFRFTEQALR